MRTKTKQNEKKTKENHTIETEIDTNTSVFIYSKRVNTLQFRSPNNVDFSNIIISIKYVSKSNFYKFSILLGYFPNYNILDWTFNRMQARNNAGFRLTCRSPLCRYVAWSSLAVSELQLSAATPLWLYHRAASLQSWIEFNCLRSAAVGKAARLSIYWLDAACRLVIPLRQMALAQLNKYHHQSGNAASGKLVWNQHKTLFLCLQPWGRLHLQTKHCEFVSGL